LVWATAQRFSLGNLPKVVTAVADRTKGLLGPLAAGTYRLAEAVVLDGWRGAG
jgi:hypothetical protein